MYIFLKKGPNKKWKSKFSIYKKKTVIVKKLKQATTVHRRTKFG